MSNRATTAAKGRPKKSYARGKSRKEDPEAMILWMPDETFCEEMSEWVEGQLWLDMSHTLEVPLKHVGLDVRQRKFLWPDAKRLDLDQSVRADGHSCGNLLSAAGDRTHRRLGLRSSARDAGEERAGIPVLAGANPDNS